MSFFCGLLSGLHTFSITCSFPQPGADTEFLLILLRAAYMSTDQCRASKEKPSFTIS